MKEVLRRLRWPVAALVLGLALCSLGRQLQSLELAQVRAALNAITASSVALCLAATAISFACLAAYEGLATRWLAPGRIPRATAWRVALVSHALANTLGFHPVLAVALRLREYRPHGVDGRTLAKIVAAVGACVAGGVLAIVLLALGWSQLRAGQANLALAVCLVAMAAFALARLRPGQAKASPWLPRAGLLAAIGLLEMGSAVLALAVLLPAGALPEGPGLILLFVSASLLGILSHSPGGLGVFEASMLAAAAPSRRAEVLAALVAYRLLYNLLPCGLALLAIGVARLRAIRQPWARLSSRPGSRA